MRLRVSHIYNDVCHSVRDICYTTSNNSTYTYWQVILLYISFTFHMVVIQQIINANDVFKFHGLCFSVALKIRIYITIFIAIVAVSTLQYLLYLISYHILDALRIGTISLKQKRWLTLYFKYVQQNWFVKDYNILLLVSLYNESFYRRKQICNKHTMCSRNFL